jgi:hypothetical protein
MIVFFDVDGVVRNDVEGEADPRVVAAVKSLLEKHKKIHVVFLSGTPVSNDRNAEDWQRGNVPLQEVFRSSFKEEVDAGKVAIYGVMGGQQLMSDGSMSVVDQYRLQDSFELNRLLIRAFLKEVAETGSVSQVETAKSLQPALDAVTLSDFSQPTNVVAKEFRSIVLAIRDSLDPGFRLINNGGSIASKTSNSLWKTAYAKEWMQEELKKPAFSHLPDAQKQIGAGLEKKGDIGVNFCVISKTSKGPTTKTLLKSISETLPNALVVTLGDTASDYPMHKEGDIAFHVGLEDVLRKNPLVNGIMVRNSLGADSQHVAGTLKVLRLLDKAMGKSFDDFRYIPTKKSDGSWKFRSIRELCLE